jgi:minor extracellular serine protease Vpr
MFQRIIILISFFASLGAFAQNKLSVSTKHLLRDIGYSPAFNKNTTLPAHVASQYGMYYKNGEYHAGALVWFDKLLFSKSDFTSRGIVVSTIVGDVATFRIPLSQLSFVINHPAIKYIEAGETVEPDLNRSLATTKANKVHAGLGGLSRAYTGKGVVIAVIDWGFDYTHPVFYDTSLTQLRIVKAWDQNKLSGPPPEGYTFGTEYKGMQELLAAKEDTLYVFGPGSHGTHVAGIAGGSGAGLPYKGIAPESELIFISLLRETPSLIDAFNYVAEYAASVEKPFVVNMSFGNHLGPHDGTLLEQKAMDMLAGNGRVFVGSAGNNGDIAFHVKGTFADSTDTVKTVVNFGNVPDMFGQVLSMWSSQNSSFSVKMMAVNSANETVFETPYYHSYNEPNVVDTFTFSSADSMIVRVTAVAKSPLNDRANIRLEVRKLSALRLVLCITSNTGGEVHAWNNIRLNNRVTNWGTAFTANYPGAIAGDVSYGLGDPAGNGLSVITVASHTQDIYNAQDSIISFAALSTFSSQGPTIDGRVKPDISGPGQNVVSSVNSFDPANASATIKVNFNGKDYPFAAYSGTSMSGPAVAGVVALMLEVNKFLSAAEIKNILKQTARLDIRTGNIPPEGSVSWGWGKVDALAAVLAAEAYTSVKEVRINPDDVKLYPNPAKSHMNIEGMQPVKVTVYDILGNTIMVSDKTTIDISSLSKGVYLIRMDANNETVIKKLWVE